MPPTVLWHVLQAGFGLCGCLVVIGRIRQGRRTSAQWLALTGFCAWTSAAATEAAWPVLAQAGVDVDFRHLAVNLLNVVVMLLVALVITGFGIRERLRPAFVIAAIAAGLMVWWLPGHGAIVERRAHTPPTVWLGMALYLGYVAATIGSLLELGRSGHRINLPLPTLVNLRLLHAMAAAALGYTGVKALLFVGVQAEWPGFSVSIAEQVLPILLLGFGVLYWLALAPPDALMALAARIDATEVRGFAIAFALQTKDDLAHGRDLGWRSVVIALAEQVAQTQDFGFDELANLRLAAALVHTDFELRAPDGASGGMPAGGREILASDVPYGVHPVVGRTVWVPSETLQVLREAASDIPQIRAARVLKVVDSFAAIATPWGPSEAASADLASALAVVGQQFPDWPEASALRSVVSQCASV